MKKYIMANGLVEQHLMKRLVLCHPVLRRQDIVVDSDDSRVPSSARTMLAMNEGQVAVVLDTHTIDQRAIAEQRGFTEWYLGSGGLREDWELILVVPQTVVLLFQDEDVLRAVLPQPLTFEQRIVARYEPKRILTEVFAQAGKPYPQALIRKLRRANLGALWKLEVLQPLERFLLGSSQPQHPGNPA